MALNFKPNLSLIHREKCFIATENYFLLLCNNFFIQIGTKFGCITSNYAVHETIQMILLLRSVGIIHYHRTVFFFCNMLNCFLLSFLLDIYFIVTTVSYTKTCGWVSIFASKIQQYLLLFLLCIYAVSTFIYIVCMFNHVPEFCNDL